MVGDPKHLSDLTAIEADVRITCRTCGFEEDWERNALAAHLFAIGGSQVWSELTRYLRCRRFGCGSARLRATPVPYARRAANMPRRVGRLDAQLIAAALEVLHAAARRSCGQAVATADVRLALFVVHRYIRDPACVRTFWTRASVGNRTVDDGLTEPLQVIRQRLVAAGWLAPEVLIQPTRTWPWCGPPPAGWFAPPNNLVGPPAADEN